MKKQYFAPKQRIEILEPVKNILWGGSTMPHPGSSAPQRGDGDAQSVKLTKMYI